MSDLDLLVDMGFSRNLAEEALKCTGNTGLDAAMDWLIQRQEDNEHPHVTATEDSRQQNTDAKSFKCDDCSKFFRTNEDIQLHSARTGHVNFSESLEKLKPLSEEERKEQMNKLEDLLRQKKVEREAAEEQAELEREKIRRKHGKDIVSAKAKFEEEEIRRMIEAKKREKEEEKSYRERLRAEIARDREDKKLLHLDEKVSTDVPTSTTNSTSLSISDMSSSICRLQIRLPTGLPLKCDFSPSTPLSTVLQYISENWPDTSGHVDVDSISVMTSFPKREYSTNDLHSSLSDLGLCPSAVLIARRKP